MIRTYYASHADVLSRHCISRLNRSSSPSLPQDHAAGFLTDVMSSERDPVIVTPSASIRSELMRAFVKADTVSAGVEWQTRAGILSEVADEKLSKSLFSEHVTWMILRVLLELRDRQPSSEWTLLARYAERPDRDLYNLARRINRLFTAYATFRPEWLLAWSGHEEFANHVEPAVEASPHAAWQKALVKRLSADGLDLSPLKILPERIAQMGREARWRRDIVVFMPIMISPMLELFLKAASDAGAEVSIYLLAPALAEHDAADEDRVDMAPFSRWHENASRLMSRCRKLGKVQPLEETFPNAETSMLAALQKAVALQSSASDAVPPYDESITLLRASSLQREIETFADRLQTLFAKDETLTPGDVMMLFPDIDAAASAVHAVLGRLKIAGKEHAPLLIPYAVTGESHDNETSLQHVLPGLLRLSVQSCTRADLKSWLTEPAVMTTLGLSLDDIRVLDTWFTRAGFVSGIDEDHLYAVEKTDPHDDRTLARALERLGTYWMMGDIEPFPVAPETLATSGDDGPTWTGVTDASSLFEKLVRIGQCLSGLARLTFDADSAMLTRPIASDNAREQTWLTELMPILATLFPNAADARPQSLLLPIESALRSLGRDANPSPDTAFPVNADLLAQALDAMLETPVDATRLYDVVTASKVSMLYGLKKRIVGIFGLSRGCGFCEAAASDEFDLRNVSTPRLSDRDGLSEDHHRFLGIFQNCTEWLHLSYSGSSANGGRDDPSSLIVDVRSMSGIPVIDETASPYLKRAFLTRKDDDKAPERSWRSTNRHLADKINAPGPIERPCTPFPPLPLLGCTADGELDFNILKNWFKKPAETILKAAGFKLDRDEEASPSLYRMQDDSRLNRHMRLKALYERQSADESAEDMIAILTADPTISARSIREDVIRENCCDIAAMLENEAKIRQKLDSNAVRSTLKLTVPVDIGTCRKATYICKDAWVSEKDVTLLRSFFSRPSKNSDVKPWSTPDNEILDLLMLKAAFEKGEIEVISPVDPDQMAEIERCISSVRLAQAKSKNIFHIEYATPDDGWEGNSKGIVADPAKGADCHAFLVALIELFEWAKTNPSIFVYSNIYSRTAAEALLGASKPIPEEPQLLATNWIKAIVTKQKADDKRRKVIEDLRNFMKNMGVENAS